MKRLLIAADRPAGLPELFRAELPDHEILTALPEDGGPVPYAVVGRPPAGVIGAIPGLELLLSLYAGVEHLLASPEVPHELPIVRMVDPGLVTGMVEWVAAHVLAWHRQLFFYRDRQREGRWEPRPERLAGERTVTILGVGALGTPVATALAALGFRVRGWSRTPRAIAGVTGFAGPDALAAAVDGADALVNLLPLTPETGDIVNLPLLSRMAPGGLFVNGGRGASVNDPDLVRALDKGAIGTAVLDVFREEPLPAESPYWTHPGVIVSPHVAAPTHPRTAVASLAAAVRAYEAGEPVPNLVDRTRGY